MNNNEQNNTAIQWNKVTWYSKLLSIVFLILVLPVIAFYIGREYQEVKSQSETMTAVSEVPTKKESYKLAAVREGKILNVDITENSKTITSFSFEAPSLLEESANEQRPEGYTYDMYADVPWNAYVSISPDNRSVAYVDNKKGLSILDISTGASKVIRSGGGYALSNLIWSPDSKYLVYTIPHYELATFGIADVINKKYKDDVMPSGSEKFTWTTKGNDLFLQFTSALPYGIDDASTFVPETYESKVDSVDSLKFVKIK